MKSINQYILEKLADNSNYKYFPKTKKELKSIIDKRIKEEGDEADLNDIDVSKITDMSYLFSGYRKFNGDIIKWDVSNVTDMQGMFYECESFNQDISNWDVSNVENMEYMFCECAKFNSNISNWDVSNVNKTKDIFYRCRIKENYKPKFKN